MSSDPILLILLYLSLFAVVVSRNYYWRTFPLITLALLYTFSYFQELPFSLRKFVVLGPVLFVQVLLFLGLSPLQLLTPPKKRDVPKSIEIIYNPKDGIGGAKGVLIDIVAVHGLGSTPKRAWVHKGTGKFWLQDFLPNALPNARIMTFNHDSDWSSNTPQESLSDYGRVLLKDLEKNRKSQDEADRPIIFIGHSFGGIIIKRALVIASNENKPLKSLVKGAVFLGTPHHGSQMSLFGKIQSLLTYWVGSRTDLLELLETDSRENEQLNEDYLGAYPRVQHYDFFELQPERLPFFGISTGMPVPKKYATIPGKENRGLDATHRELNKFSNALDGNYLAVKDIIVDFFENATERRITLQEEKQRSEVLVWLAYSSFDTENAEHDRRWTSGTCEWVCKRQEFKDWNSSVAGSGNNSVLYIFGKAGCGKTYIAQYLRKKLEENPRVPVVYFYFESKHAESAKNTAIAFFRTILYQLLKQSTNQEAISAGFVKAYALKQDSHTSTCTGESILGLKELLVETLKLFKEVRLVIDALDECTAGSANRTYVEDLISLAQSIGPLKIIITSRSEQDILQKSRRVSSLLIDIPKRSTDADISLYINHRLTNEASQGLLSLRKKIEDTLKKKAQGMFIYVRLVMDEIMKAKTREAVERRLGSLPGTLEELYQQALEKIRNTHKDAPEDFTRAVDIFLWVITAHHPLKVAGLHMALRAENLKDKGLDHKRLGESLLDPADQIKSYCFPFIEILADDTVRLIHFSVTEYFRQLKKPSLQPFHYKSLEANSKIALTCVAYLSIQHMTSTSETSSRLKDGEVMPITEMDQESECYDFLSYAINHWPYHLQRSEEEFPKQSPALVDHLQRSEEEFPKQSPALVDFCRPDNPAFIAWIHDRAGLDGRFRVFFGLKTTAVEQLPSPLHITTYCGLTALSEKLIEEYPSSISLKDGTGATPLHIAAQLGLGDLVKKFLQHEANPEATDENKQTALHRAATKGHLSAVKELLKGGANIDTRDKFKRTALFLSSLYGKTNIVSELLENGAGLDCESVSGDTPLTASIANGHSETLSALLSASKTGPEDLIHLRSSALNGAARKGFTDIVKLLLNSGVNIKATDNVKQTALHTAATSGHQKVVEQLLECNAEVDAREQSERTPLYFAAEHGHLVVVKQLLKAGANIGALDRRNQTVLFKPAGKGHLEVLEELLSAKIDVQAKDHWGRTALHWAACSGQVETTKRLLTANSPLEAREWEQQTPLHWAAKNGRDNVIPVLLEAGADADVQDKYGYSPLHWAAIKGNPKVFELLLPRSNPNCETPAKVTPLHLAAIQGHSRIVEQLIVVKTNVNAQDTFSMNALHHAALRGHHKMVKSLLEAGCSARTADHNHQTPLHLAASKGYDGIALELLVEPSPLLAEDKRKRKPADRARVKGHTSLAKTLAIRESMERQRLLSQQSDTLHEAAHTGEVDKVRQLISTPDTNTQTLDIWGKTALHWAAEGGYDEVINLLLKTQINPDAVDNSKRTALHLAADNGHEKVIQQLLTVGVKVDIPDIWGQTALHSASQNGSEAIVHHLLRSGANVNANDKWGQTALHLASYHGQKDVVRLLLKHKIAAYAKDEKSRTALHRAAKKGHDAVVQELLSHVPAVNIDGTDWSGQTALHLAAENGCGTVLLRLLQNKADEKALDKKKRTALHLAAGSGDDSVLLWLMRPGLIYAQDNEYNTPLHYAARKGSEMAALKLLEAGSRVGMLNNLEQTALHIAAQDGHTEIVKHMLEHSPKGLNLNTRDYWQKTPIQWASENGHEEVVKLLIDAGYDIMAVGDRQDTALHLASENGHENVVALLLSNGAFMDAALYRTRQTPLHLAASKGLSSIVQQLLKAGANPEALDNRSETPMHLAVRYRHKGVVEELLMFDAESSAKNSAGKSPIDIAEECGWKEISILFSRGEAE